MRRFTLSLLILLTACTKTSGPRVEVPLPEKGKTVYSTHCISCHGPNPHVDGPIGPAIYGSSLDLLQHRVLHADYPAGYRPKRDTHIMPTLPYLKDDIPALHAYLNSP